MKANTPMRLRTVRHIATGRESTQSTKKTKRMLKTGQFVEVGPELSTACRPSLVDCGALCARPSERNWRRSWTLADRAVAACGTGLLVTGGVWVAVLKMVGH